MASGLDLSPVIAIDLGGTNLRAGIVTPQGDLTQRRQIPTEAAAGPDAVIARIARLIADVADAAGLASDTPVGVAAPGPLNPRTGIVHFTPNLIGWRNLPLRDRLQTLTERAVSIGNDGNCAALGEARFGAAAGAQDLIYFALGTGVGGGVISGGHLVEGTLGLGGEIGHIAVAQDGPRCRCGGVGCLEAFASGWAIARDGELVARTDDGEALRAAAADASLSAKMVADVAAAGDPAAGAILRRVGRAVGAAMGSLINVFNPEMVVLGGGVAMAGDVLLEPAREALRQHAFPASRASARIMLSALGEDTALLGAAALVLAARKDQEHEIDRKVLHEHRPTPSRRRRSA